MKKIFIFSFLAVVAIFLARNIIVKYSLSYYLRSNLKTEISLKKIDLGLKKIIINKVGLAKGGLHFTAKDIVLEYDISFPFQIKPHSLKITGAWFEDKRFGSLAFDLVPSGEAYFFNADGLSIQGKKIGSFSLSFQLKGNRVNFNNLKSSFINSSAVVDGYLNLTNLNNICIDLSVENLSLAAIVFLFAKKEDMDLEGHFDGGGSFCFKNNKISQLNLDIDDLEGGKINLKKKASLDFLKKRLDKKSYSYLLDNLKNYKYDKGSIEVDVEKNDIILEAIFFSEELGERNITVKLHDVLVK
ncbi:MAG: hypothetical protein K9L69_04225 [Candidatus Omnitrophica bacterium]|nr:hypothetical protein [Candidatus Omnitrophota bacterium]MCF7895318.1 hypothetical protein [Candidatus Omnitrophota bacterium]